METGKILIVDDDPVVRSVLSDLLETVGNYQTDSAGDGLEAIKKVKDNDYDIVFTDLTMPRLTGIDFLKESKKIRPQLPVVVITGNATLESAVNAMREGARDFITKPFNITAVASVAERTIGEKRLLSKLVSSGDLDGSLGRLNKELFRKLQEISVLQALSSEIDDLYDNKKIYERIVEMASRIISAKEVTFGIIEHDSFKIKSSMGTSIRNVPVANSLLERVIASQTYYLASFGEISPHTGRPLTIPFFSIPMTMHNEVFAILNIADKADGSGFTEDEISLVLTFVKKAAQRIENNALYEVFYNNLINTLKSLVISIEARDPYTQRHSERVTRYALQIADVMHISPEGKDAISFGGYLHDIGKIGVRDTILLKPGKLTPEEFAEIKMHPVIGDNIIKPIRFFPKERELILHHHENFNGSGYPGGLAGDNIPLTARILAVADTYDAMTTSRPYRTALSHEHAVAEIRRCSQTQFDADVVRAFLQTHDKKENDYGTETGR
jgi:response regulator RpfG family c-di-GMP phosphodiesterase